MNLTQLMELFKNPETIDTLSFGGKLTGSLITTVMGMGITFTALIILLIAINGMYTVLYRKKSEQPVESPVVKKEERVVPTDGDDDEEEIAAVMAAILLYIRPKHNQVIIKNIRRVDDFHPRWSQAGIHEQLDSRL